MPTCGAPVSALRPGPRPERRQWRAALERMRIRYLPTTLHWPEAPFWTSRRSWEILPAQAAAGARDIWPCGRLHAEWMAARSRPISARPSPASPSSRQAIAASDTASPSASASISSAARPSICGDITILRPCDTRPSPGSAPAASPFEIGPVHTVLDRPLSKCMSSHYSSPGNGYSVAHLPSWSAIVDGCGRSVCLAAAAPTRSRGARAAVSCSKPQPAWRSLGYTVHPGTVESTEAAGAGNAGSARREAMTDRERAAVHREHAANEREHAADRRARTADERQRLAEEREHRANEREALADRRERRADEREREADLREAALNERHREADERERELDERGRALGAVVENLQ